ncbi:hypothetical protein [Telluribacter sp.]|jgi:hypothetical protein|uniref:hypothetical protein n=1 Tax=Telluribacter sp. TaxID=1978767 RepID=UPI002E102A2D|nr:hypothetical protein [Telluribacter sp.]
MKKSLFTILILFVITVANAQTQRWAVGFKLGEPTGVNLRKYGNSNALDLTVGTYGALLGMDRLYRNGTYRNVGIMLNATYLWYTPLLSERMIAYAGAGAQLNTRRYYPDQFSRVGAYTNNISIGPSATAGLEYFSRRTSSSYFLEGGSYVELLPAFLFVSPQVSAGIRHNF